MRTQELRYENILDCSEQQELSIALYRDALRNSNVYGCHLIYLPEYCVSYVNYSLRAISALLSV